MANQRDRIRQGMGVVGSDRTQIGLIQEVREDDFLVSRQDAGDVFVPFDAASSTGAQQVVLTVAASDVDLQNWPHAVGSALTGGMPASPGPAGSGMPTEQPGGPPTFVGGGDADEQQPGSGNLTSSRQVGPRGGPAMDPLPDSDSQGRLGGAPIDERDADPLDNQTS